MPMFTNNILADFVGWGLNGVLGILLSLIEVKNTKKGKIIDVSITDSVSYLSNWMLN